VFAIDLELVQEQGTESCRHVNSACGSRQSRMQIEPRHEEAGTREANTRYRGDWGLHPKQLRTARKNSFLNNHQARITSRVNALNYIYLVIVMN